MGYPGRCLSPAGRGHARRPRPHAGNGHPPGAPALSRPRSPSRHPMSSAVKPRRPPLACCGECVPGARQCQGSPAGGLRPALTLAALRQGLGSCGRRGPGMEAGGSGGGWLGLAVAVSPGGVLVVAGAGFEAAVQDAGQPVADLSQRGVVALAAGTQLVVVSAGAGGGGQ